MSQGVSRSRVLTAVAGRSAALVASFILGAIPVCGQDQATFVTLGPLGIGGVHGQSGLALHAAIGHRFGRSIVSGRAAAVLLDDDAFLWDEVWDIAVLYGRSFGGEGAPFSIAAGPAYVGGSFIDQDRTLGLALEAQAMGRVSRWLAIGVCGFGNLNGRSSFGGITLAVRFGGP